MTQLVDQLADLTALRDRDLLDAALVTTLQELIQPSGIAIYRLVGPSDNEHWLTCVHRQPGVEETQASQTWADIDALPLAADFAARQLALSKRQPVIATSTPWVNVFPLTTQSASQGVLELECGDALSAESVRLVRGVLRLFQNFQGLLDYGERDALTELLNRKTFDGAFLKATTVRHDSQELAADDRRRSSDAVGGYWLAMLDIDHFKHVNDGFGHLIGDEVLLLLARLMRSTFRFHDQLYRFGGEEFVVLMRCAQAGQAEAALERLRRTTEQYSFSRVGHITISIGFTQILPGDSPSGAFERADKAVYYAKEHGRNQVCGHEALVAQGKLAAQAVNVGDIELF